MCPIGLSLASDTRLLLHVSQGSRVLVSPTVTFQYHISVSLYPGQEKKMLESRPEDAQVKRKEPSSNQKAVVVHGFLYICPVPTFECQSSKRQFSTVEDIQ